MENKKISFGFSKITKRNEIFSKPPKTESKVELIECLEGQSIKIKDAVEEIKGPMVIPIKDSSKNLLDRVKEAKEKRIKTEIKQESEALPDSALSIDELAARELIREAQNRNTIKSETKIFTLPLNEDKFVAEGEAEPSLEDYDNVPISDYGMAMLRGMGWKEGMPIGKTQSKTVLPIVPELRPKGLGLGANKMVAANTPTESVDKDGKKLQLVKGAFGKIIAGGHKGHYCEVQGFDDENCRVIVKTALTNQVLSLNEFLIVPVTREEFALGSKIINNAKYEEYKEKAEKNTGDDDRHRSRSRSRDRNKKKKKKSSRKESESDDSDLGDDRSRSRKKKSKKSKHRSSPNDSEDDRRRKSRKKNKSRHKRSGSDSDDRRRKSDKKERR